MQPCRRNKEVRSLIVSDLPNRKTPPCIAFAFAFAHVERASPKLLVSQVPGIISTPSFVIEMLPDAVQTSFYCYP